MLSSISDKYLQVAEWLRTAQRVACMTGAGVSAESGIATFRGPGGLWEGRRPEEVATPEAFAADPDLVCRFYHARRVRLAECRPNPAHTALAELEASVPEFTLITQNVDDLHRCAGSRNIVELHGNLWTDRCSECGQEVRLAAPPAEPIARCQRCAALMRPGVVWFGEMLPEDALQKAMRAVAECGVLLVVGTSSVVQPAASLAWQAKRNRAHVVEINPQPTPLTDFADVVIAEKAGVALPAVVAAVLQLRPPKDAGVNSANRRG